MIAKTTTRVEEVTAPSVNDRIQFEIEARIAWYREHPEAIDERLQELDREWDMERTLEANAGAVGLATTILGLFGRRRWFFMPGIVGGFLLQHAIQGWCPPVPLFRRIGVRTAREIDWERTALMAIGGDFGRANGGGAAEAERPAAAKPRRPARPKTAAATAKTAKRKPGRKTAAQGARKSRSTTRSRSASSSSE